MANERQPLYVFKNDKEVGLDKVPPGSLVGFLCNGAIFRLADKTGIINTTLPKEVKGTKLKEYVLANGRDPNFLPEDSYYTTIVPVATFVAEISGNSWDSAMTQTNKWKEAGMASITLPILTPDFKDYSPDFAYPGEPADPYETIGSAWWNASADLDVFWKPLLIGYANAITLPNDYPNKDKYIKMAPLVTITSHDIWVTARYGKY